MPNKNYLRGRRFEYETKREISCPSGHKKYGCFSFRMAGSHSPYDVGSVCFLVKVITFIQCKTQKGNKDVLKISGPFGNMETTFEKWVK